MTTDDIWALASKLESENLGFKKTTGERREAAKSICAMLNHRGGVVVFGVTPKREVVGQMVGENTIEKLSAELYLIEPTVLPSIEQIPVSEGREVIVVRVNRGEMVPYRYQNLAFRRVGNTNRRLSRDDENLMFLERVHGEHRWENQPASDWSVEDLDADELQRTVNERYGRGVWPTLKLVNLRKFYWEWVWSRTGHCCAPLLPSLAVTVGLVPSGPNACYVLPVFAESIAPSS